MLLAFAQAAGAEVNFDRGVDVQSAINTAVNSDIVIPAARFGQLMDITRDCREVTFKAEDPLSSPEIPLASMQTSQECQNMGYPAGQICWPVSQYYNAKAQIVITQPRVLQPGQKEVFEVCLWGGFLSLKQISPAYKYSVRQILDVFQLTPENAAPAVSRAGDDVCRLVMDNNYSCVYQCKDGSYISNPAPFGPPPFPGMGAPFHGCPPTVHNMPLITVTK